MTHELAIMLCYDTSVTGSGVTGGGQGGRVPPPRDFPTGNFWQLIGKNEARKEGKKMGNVQENEEKWKKEGWKLGKIEKKIKKEGGK